MSLAISITEDVRAIPDERLEALIRAAVAGDRSALEGVLASVERRVYLLSWRLVGDSSAAEDISQEVLLKLARHLGRYRPGTNLWGWIYRIVVNQVHDYRKSVRVMPETPMPMPVPVSDPDRQEQLERVEAALAILTPKEREAVILLDVEGYSSREAASIAGTLAITVRTRAAHARMKLRRYLSRYYPELKEGS
jgi:RNA polymerase sigma-70 factor (ECF subfamily)